MLLIMVFLVNYSDFLEKAKHYLTNKPLPSLEERKKYDYEFATSTSFHGVHNIVRTKSKTRKVLWMLVLIGSIVIVAWQIRSRFIYYFSWPTTTSVDVQYVEKIEFPAVTFCNLNRFQTQAVANLSIIFFLWSIVSGVLSVFKIGDMFGQELTDFLQGNQNFSIKEFTRHNGFYINNSTLLDCEYFGKPCYPEAQFTDDPALGFVDAGITFAIHSPKEPPRFDGLGITTPVGMHAHAAIRQEKILFSFKRQLSKNTLGENVTHTSDFSTIRSIAPMDVYKNARLDIYRNGVDAYHSCYQLCFLFLILSSLSHSHIYWQGNGTECDLEKFYSCVSPALYDIELKGLCTVGTHNSTCPVPCEETDYPASISYSTFASEKASKFLSTKLRKTPEYIRNNLVYIDIKYHDLNYKVTQQQKALSVSELLADIGGQLGLFCGASMITVIEILEYIVTNCCWMCVFLLLKAPEVPNWDTANQNQPPHKRRIQEC
ncbi:hypothetical protein lerEdw1_012181 [Lerista edwardsae]|nr:hypothetical protein lerEdw1_012181 [Lerista edwardsae]